MLDIRTNYRQFFDQFFLFLESEYAPQRNIPIHVGTNPPDYISYIYFNTEQLSRHGQLNQLLNCIQTTKPAEIWDYSQINCDILKAHGINAIYFPLKSPKSYIDKCKAWRNEGIIYDIGFCGFMSDRRRSIIISLQKKGFNLPNLEEIYGEERDKILAKCKIHINIHAAEEFQIFESARCALWLDMGITVVSEPSLDDDPRCITVPYNSIVDSVSKLLYSLQDVLYIAYFIENGGWQGDIYIDSIVTMFTKFYGKPFLFVTEQLTYDKFISKIQQWDTCNIVIIDFKNSTTYKQYYDICNTYSQLDKNIHVKQTYCDNIYFMVIHYYKFEMLQLAKNYSYPYVCYIDSGIFRDNRIHFIKNFMDAGFNVNGRNDIMVNYTTSQMEMDIDIDDLLKYGSHEIACGHMFFSTRYIDELGQKYFEKLDELLNQQIITTEQRIFTLVVREKYKTNPTMFTFKKVCSTYEVCFHVGL